MLTLFSRLRNSSQRLAFTWLLLGACTGSIEAPENTHSQGNSTSATGGGNAVNSGGHSATSGGMAGMTAGNTTSGGSGNGNANGGSAPALEFSCDANAKPPEAVLRRLTMTQYRNTLQELLKSVLGDDARTVSNEIAASLAELPEDRREIVPQDLHGSYRRLDQSLQQAHVDSTYEVAVAAGTALTTAARLSKVVGTCATDSDRSNDGTCLDSFVAKFGARVLRRPLTSDDVAFYKSAYGTDTTASAASYADLIAIFLTAPEFLYFVEHGGAAVAGQSGVYDVSAYELASRLAYQLWQSPPDDELSRVAADASLLTPSVYEAQVVRLIADPRAHTTLDEFFQDWTKMEDLPALDAKNSDVVFKAFAGDDLPNANLRKAMQDDALALLDFQTWNESAPVASWFASERSFARDARLAKIYGAPVWDGASVPPPLPTGQRPGLLTRALFLASGSANTRPIMKGVFIRKNILCNDIPPPPPGANAKPPVLEPGMTTRESVEALTEVAGSVCAGCHTQLINPLGYATENYDALGRFRSMERLFDEAGKLTGERPVDVSGVPQVRVGDRTEVQSTAQLMQLIAGSGAVEACLSRNFFRFTYARWEDDALDGCALRAAHEAIRDGAAFADILHASVLTPAFRQRRFE